MTEWEPALTRAREEFIEGFARRGFQLRDGSLYGDLELPGHGPRRVEIRIPDAFPYAMPKVRPADGSGDLSWHREPDGWLCLYASSESSDLPWMDAAAFADRTLEWFLHHLAGWAGDPPDLDLDRYFDGAPGFVIYHDLESLIGKPIRAERRDRGILRVVGPGVAPRRGRRRHIFGWAEDLGELERPVRDWAGLAAALGDRADQLARRIDRGEGDLLLLRYRRGTHLGALALSATRGTPIALRAIHAADESVSTLRLRAGADADVLAEKSVAIVGLGAVGSFLADLLVRGGIGALELWDGDRFRPGNAVRHLVGPEYAGWPKVDAVADLLIRSGRIEASRVTKAAEPLARPADAVRLLEDHDLVIDATASGPVTAMLGFLAGALSRSLLSVCAQRDGGVVRGDRWPVASGEVHAPAVPPREGGVELRESGCGDPVSAAPAAAAIEAASLGWRMAVDILTARKELPVSVVQVVAPQEDEPYAHLGVVP